MAHLLSSILIAVAAVIFLLLIWAGMVSLKEQERRAANRFFWLSVLLPLPYLLLGLISFDFRFEAGLTLLILTFIPLIIFLIPLGRNKTYRQQVPMSKIDERDTMFSRNELKPGSKQFEEYYNRKPEKKKKDDIFRKKAGLLQPAASQYHPLNFAAADASFETIEALKHKVDGPVSGKTIEVDPASVSDYIKMWSKKLGAVDCGITKLKGYHLYSFGGRAERYGKKVVNEHQFAIAFTVEMDKEMVDSAPTSTIVMESGQQYLESGIIALQAAAFIRGIGYEARAHIDGNYEVVCPLVARDAGLGEIGRMGLLMTPRLGPRVRISVVTTNLPLIPDNPVHDHSVIDFCTLCKKCADACPGKAISFNDREEIDGVKRWQIKQEACFTLWCELGTDCGRCMSVCPYSHSDNLMHGMVRKGLGNSSLFRMAALKLDDYFYGRKPSIKPLQDWMNLPKK